MATITDPQADRTEAAPLRFLKAVPMVVYTLVGLLVFWELAVRLGDVPSFILPTPTAIAMEFYDYGHRLFPNAMVTLFEVLLGFTLAVLIGVPLAVSIVYSKFMAKGVYPLIVASQTIPKVAIAPLLLTWFGYGMTPKIVIVILLAFFPIVINSVMGLKSAPDEMLHLARSMGASSWQTFWKFRLPQALPSIFAGLKLATALSVIGAVVAEFIGADKGLGYLIVIAGANFDVTRQFAAIICIALIGMSFFLVLERVERFAIPWRDKSDGHD
ncbi:ABC transporter permease [Roseisalinus antarcticus]|uniref:Putative aliphatic sulfonates transport permease protein SsuC n=1 Tax=Roseisalinus antarcticus TaxID=254357 RepID=A0A1Y5TB74_9RHOB|nr:ABC transporter permease [Roseisalinus antarcticus]SLN56426.1 Putative aliphatic sulfonates transport permease protein SsuC [Roseisalinus antarcticus]